MKTILVVDDSDSVVNAVSKLLKTADFHVLQANSGTAALELVANYAGSIDLLLSDVQMPGMSGPALAEAIKISRPGIKVVLMSTFTGERLLDWPFIEKPFTLVRLLGMINDALHKEMKAKSADAG
jgi:two-component system cell cycle sensor histidine kinase/response regulator CckA